MGLIFGKRRGSIPSKLIKRNWLIDFLPFVFLNTFEITAIITFMDYNQQTMTLSFEINAADPTSALDIVRFQLLPAFTADKNLQGLTILNYTLTIRQEIGGSDGATMPIPQYGNQREMYGVLQFPVNGEVVEVRIPNPNEAVLLPTDKRYLDLNHPALTPLIALYTSGTLLVRGQTPGNPIQGYIRHTDSKTETKKTKIG
jgi:hypothetical protein